MAQEPAFRGTAEEQTARAAAEFAKRPDIFHPETRRFRGGGQVQPPQTSADDWWRKVVAPEIMLIRAALQAVRRGLYLIAAALLVLALVELIT